MKLFQGECEVNAVNNGLAGQSKRQSASDRKWKSSREKTEKSNVVAAAMWQKTLCMKLSHVRQRTLQIVS
jgi:hypothetical protein